MERWNDGTVGFNRRFATQPSKSDEKSGRTRMPLSYVTEDPCGGQGRIDDRMKHDFGDGTPAPSECRGVDGVPERRVVLAEPQLAQREGPEDLLGHGEEIGAGVQLIHEKGEVGDRLRGQKGSP